MGGDWPGFALWYMPGLSLLQAGWSLVEITSSGGAALLNVLLVNHLLVRLPGAKTVHSGNASVGGTQLGRSRRPERALPPRNG
jgi:hypothetical protein